MNKIINTSPLLLASISHYTAERDKALAELDICLNKSTSTGDSGNVTNKVISLFKSLAEAQSVLELINGIKSDNEKELASIISDLNNKSSFITSSSEQSTQKQ